MLEGTSTTTTTLQQQQQTQNQRRQAPPPEIQGRQFKLWPAEQFQTVALEWAQKYPNFIKVTTAQAKFNLPAAGSAQDCPFWKDGDGCPNYILELQDYVTHPLESTSSNQLPEVFISGCLHGNERVGPTAVMEALTVLLEAAACEALPAVHANDEKQALACRADLEQRGISNAQRKWLARLLTTRRIIVTPTSNALGYFQDKREEGLVDPNRDFPYDLTDASKCMKTIVGRTLNELYRQHMFQLALTFHAGTEVVGYEWGAPTYLNHWSPDDTAQSDIGGAYSRFGGSFATSKVYDYGTMNDLVYYVRGGMEDWAYAGSFDPERVITCKPTTFGGYPEEKTQYDNSTLRVFNMLIETSNDKTPRTKTLGTTLNLLDSDTAGNGHVSRNIRLSLLAMELVEPYTAIVGVNQLALSDDIVPLTERGNRSCQKTKAVMIAKNAQEVVIHWTVGGAITIDMVDLWYAKWDDIPQDELDCLEKIHPRSTSYFQKGTIIGPTSGTTQFSRAGAHPRPGDSEDDDDASKMEIAKETNGPIFTGTVNVPQGLDVWDQIVVVVSARVDQGWKGTRRNTKPDNMGPQSHVVNARTNPDWHHERADGKIIQGRLDWFSVPLTIVVGDFMDNVGSQGGHLVNTIEVHPRFGENVAGKGGMKPTSSVDQLWFPVDTWEVLAASVLGLALCIICCACVLCRKSSSRRRSGRAMSGGKNSDDFVFDSKPYSDQNGNGEAYSDDDDDASDDGEVELPEIA